MKNVIKAIIISLVFILLITCSVFAATTPADVKNTKYEESVVNLIDLNIVNVYADGNFKPGNTITRAEMARIICECIGMTDTAKLYKGDNKYSDIDGWASGYINMIAYLNYTEDIATGKKFYPDQNITPSEAVTYCVRMLGYGNIVNNETKLSWPTNYMVKANDLNLLSNLNINSLSDMTRGELAILLWNTFNTEMWGELSRYEGRCIIWKDWKNFA